MLGRNVKNNVGHNIGLGLGGGIEDYVYDNVSHNAWGKVSTELNWTTSSNIKSEVYTYLEGQNAR